MHTDKTKALQALTADWGDGCWRSPLQRITGSQKKLPHPKMLPVGTAGGIHKCPAFLTLEKGWGLPQTQSSAAMPPGPLSEFLPAWLCFTLLLRDLSSGKLGKQAPFAPTREMAKGGSDTFSHGDKATVAGRLEVGSIQRVWTPPADDKAWGLCR